MFDALEKWQISFVVTASNICNNKYKLINNIMLKEVIMFVDKLVRIYIQGACKDPLFPAGFISPCKSHCINWCKPGSIRSTSAR